MGVRFITDTNRTLHRNLKSYWVLDETGGLRRDLVGANHLTDKNTVTQTGGKVGANALRKAAQFTAANSEHLLVTHSPDLLLGDVDFTVAAWVYFDTKVSERSIITKRDSSTTIEYQLFYDSGSDRFRFTVSNNGTTTTAVTANTFGSPATGTWIFVIAWHDAVNDTISIQVNNGTVDSTAFSLGVFSGVASVRLGARDTTAAAFWNGRIQQVGFWRKVLSTTERTDLYNSGNGNSLKTTRFAPDVGKNLNTDLIAWWKLDEISGTRRDFIGTNDLTDNNTVTQATGKNNRGKAGQFTAVNSEYLSIADNADLSTGDIDFTIAVWVYLDSKPVGKDLWITGKRSTTAFEWGLRWRLGLDRYQFLLSGGFGVVEANNFGSPPLNQWHFIVAWHDSVTNTVNIQVNGGTVNSIATTGAPSDTTAIFTIGADSGVDDFFDGRIDDVGFWKRVLTSQERTDLYNAGKGTTPGTRFLKDDIVTLANDLIAHWKLEEDSGSRFDYIGGNLLTDNNTVTRKEVPHLRGNTGEFVRANAEYLSIADNTDLRTGNIDFTIAAWVYFASLPNIMGIVSKYNDVTGPNLEYILDYEGVGGDNRFKFVVSSNGTSNTGTVRAHALGAAASNTWYLVIAWHDSVNDTLNIQINNGAIDSLAYSAGVSAGTAASFLLGAYSAGASGRFDGFIDEVGFWKRVLTAAERTALYNKS